MLKRISFKAIIAIAITLVFISCGKDSDLKSINQPPFASAGKDTNIVLPVNTVVLDGSGSNDPDGAITAYLWSKISGPQSFNISNAGAVQTQITNLAEGAYLFELKITDDGGLSARDTVQVTVNNDLKTKMELITAGTWKLISYTSDPAYDWYGDGNYATDILSALDPCEADGFDTYSSNGTVEINEGALKCHPGDPQIFTATWEFTDNGNNIMYDGFDEYELVEITATTMRLQQTFVENGVTYTHLETYEH